MSLVARAEITLDVHRLGREVDRPLDEQVGQPLALLAAPGELLLRPRQPSLPRTRTSCRPGSCRAPAADRAPADRRRAPRRHAPDLRPHILHASWSLQVSLPAASVVPWKSVSQAKSLCPRRTLPSTVTSAPASGWALPRAVTTKIVRSGFERRAREVGHLQAHPAAPAFSTTGISGATAVHPAQAHEVGAGRSFQSAGTTATGESCEMWREVETKRCPRGVATQRQIHQYRDPRRAERRDLLRQAGRRDRRHPAGKRLRPLPGPRRPRALVDLDRTVGERPERPVERIDAVDAEIEPLVATAGERHHLRSTALHHARRGPPVQKGRRSGERAGLSSFAPPVRSSARPLWSRSAAGARVTR